MGHIFSLVSLAQLLRNNRETHKKLPQSEKRVPRQCILCSSLFTLASSHRQFPSLCSAVPQLLQAHQLAVNTIQENPA